MKLKMKLTGGGLSKDYGEIDSNSLRIFQNDALIKKLFGSAVTKEVKRIFNSARDHYLSSIKRRNRDISSGYTDVSLWQLFKNAFDASIITPEKINLLSITALMDDRVSLFGGAPSRARGKKWLMTEQENITITGYRFVPWEDASRPRGRHGSGFVVADPGKSFSISYKDMRYKYKFVNYMLGKIETQRFKNNVMEEFMRLVFDKMKHKSIETGDEENE